MKRSTSRLKRWSSRSGKIVLAFVLVLTLIPFMGAGTAVHAASSTWPAVGQSVQPSNVQTLLKVDSTLYAGTGNFGNDVWSNSNGTWTQMSGSPANVRSFLVDADGTLYAGAWGDGNNVSTYTASGGWKQMPGSPSNVYSLIDVNGAIYAGASNGSSNDVWTYTAIAGWTKMMGSPGDVQALTYINGTLYAGTGSNGVWSNSNGSWMQISNGVSNPKYIASLLNVNGMLYAAGTQSGDNRSVWTYNNSNGTWTPIAGAPARVKTLRFVSGTLYAGTASGAGFDDVWTYTTGDGWAKMNGAPGSVYALLDDNGTLYAGTQTGRNDVWTNSNGTWAQMGALPGRTNTLLSANGTLYAGTDDDNNAVWAYTTRGGWTQMSGSPGYVYALIDVNGTLYAGTSNDDDDNDVWTYDTSATTPKWTQMTVSNAPSNVYALLNVNGTLYAGTNNGDNDIWTYDTAATMPEWTQMTTGSAPSYVNTLLNVNGTLYAGNAAGGNDVWTYDTTATTPEWAQMTTSHAPSYVTSLLNVNGTLYAGTSNFDNDIWTYDANATIPEWTQMTTSHAPSGVNALLNANGTLYAGTDNDSNDVWMYSNGIWEQVVGSPSQLHALLEVGGTLYAGGINGVVQLIAPETPANLQSSSTTSVSTILSWDAVSGATGYYLYENGDNPAIATVSGTTYTVSGLTPNTSYTFTVSAFNAIGESEQSDAVPVQTLSADATLTSTIGTVSTGGTAEESITNVPYATTLNEFKAAITPAENASFEVYDADGTTVATALATGKKVIVTAQDGTTKVTYTVTVTVAANSAKAITAFGFEGLSPAVTGTVNESNKTIELTVPYGTDITSLVPTFTTTGVSVKVGSTAQESGTTQQNFTEPVTYTVVAEDNTTQDYTVTVTVAANPAKAITAFGFAGLSSVVTGTVNESNKTIALTVPYGTDVTSLVPTFTTTGVSVKVGSTEQASGTTQQNFTEPVTYTVVAADNTTQDYSVTVTVAANTAKAITAFGFAGLSPAVTGTVNESNKTIALTVPYGTNVTSLVPTFTTTGASVKVGSTEQASGTTQQNFTEPVTYTVVAADNTTQDYTVTVTVAANSAKEITAFGFAGLSPAVTGTVNESNKTIALTVPYGTNVTSLVPTFTTTGASVKVGSTEQASGTTQQNFTEPVTYTVVAADNTTQDYTVTVTVAANSAKAITAFGFGGLSSAVTGTVNESNKTIALTVPYGTNVTSLVPTFTTTGASVKVGSTTQASGTTQQNFTEPVIYTVVAADNTTQDYTVTVTVAAAPASTPTPTPTPTSEPTSGNSGTLPVTSSNNTVISTDGTLTLSIGKSGEVSIGDDVKIIIPTGASNKELKITVEKVADTQKLLTSKDVLVSPVFEILKNFPENFSKELTMIFTFDPKKLKGNQKPSVFFYDEIKKVWVEIGGEVKGNTITIKVNHFTKYAVLAAGQGEDSATVTPVNFSDISGHWAEASINQAVSFGIISGYPDGTFNPNRTVTRAEFAVMLMNTLKPQGDGAELTFIDKGKIATWAQNSVAQAVKASIINGYEDGTFRPDAEITRLEMAVMIAKALGQSVEAATATGFADEKEIPNWAKGAVGAIKKLSIIEGKGANAFAPGDKTTRAESVTVLLRMLAQNNK
ncbi:S-layer homology domain-containing protein [Paenibacillus sp. GCM10012306]|uniref:S-layer homology domain-containing protein n=1 Tax=Paenibacillus sp. GCM10012306 TaxID=3317342 RepID=UPI0036129D48